MNKSRFGNIKETPNSFNNIETSSHVIETLGIQSETKQGEQNPVGETNQCSAFPMYLLMKFSTNIRGTFSHYHEIFGLQ